MLEIIRIYQPNLLLLMAGSWAEILEWDVGRKKGESFVFQMELSSPACGNPFPLHLAPQAVKEERTREGDIGKRISWAMCQEGKVQWQCTQVGRATEGWVVTTSASCLLCDLGKSTHFSTPAFQSMEAFK